MVGGTQCIAAGVFGFAYLNQASPLNPAEFSLRTTLAGNANRARMDAVRTAAVGFYFLEYSFVGCSALLKWLPLDCGLPVTSLPSIPSGCNPVDVAAIQ